MKLRIALFLFLALLGMGVSPVLAATTDLSVSQGGISFVPMPFFVGQSVRIYTTVEQSGSSDTEGMVEFRAGDQVIGSKPISLKAGGRPEEAWMNWTPTQVGDQAVQVTVRPEAGYTDAVLGNNSVTEQVFVDQDTDHDGKGNQVDTDDDNDGVPDVRDDFPLDPQKSKDTDGDGIDDSIDSDDDNDGVYDFAETQQGTSLTDRDTDHDGVDDARDAYPTDPKRSALEPTTASTGGGGGETVPHKLPGRVLALEMVASTSTIPSLNADSDLAPRSAEMSSSSSDIESAVASATSSVPSTSDSVVPLEERELKDATSTSSLDSQNSQTQTLPLDAGITPSFIKRSLFSSFFDEGFLSILASSLLLLALLFFLLYVKSKRR